MIDIIIPFLFGLMVGAAGGVMIAALLVASRESEKIGACVEEDDNEVCMDRSGCDRRKP